MLLSLNGKVRSFSLFIHTLLYPRYSSLSAFFPLYPFGFRFLCGAPVLFVWIHASYGGLTTSYVWIHGSFAWIHGSYVLVDRSDAWFPTFCVWAHDSCVWFCTLRVWIDTFSVWAHGSHVCIDDSCVDSRLLCGLTAPMGGSMPSCVNSRFLRAGSHLLCMAPRLLCVGSRLLCVAPRLRCESSWFLCADELFSQALASQVAEWQRLQGPESHSRGRFLWRFNFLDTLSLYRVVRAWLANRTKLR